MVADLEVDTWVLSKKRKLGGSYVFVGECGGITTQICLKFLDSSSKVGHAQEKFPWFIM